LETCWEQNPSNQKIFKFSFKTPPTTNLLGVTIVLYVDIGFCKIDVAPDFAKSYVNIGSTAESM
jgi:hypothetical protein